MSEVNQLGTLLDQRGLVHRVSSEGLWLVEGTVQHVWWSDRIRHLLGAFDEVDFPNEWESWRSRLHPEDGEDVERALAVYLQQASPAAILEQVYRLRREDGAYRWFRARIAGEWSAQGELTQAVGSLVDVTEEHDQKVTLEASQVEVANLRHKLQDAYSRTAAMEAELSVAQAELYSVQGLLNERTSLLARNAEVESKRASMDARFDLFQKACADGMWDVEIIEGELHHADNIVWRSENYRSLLGYTNISEFPDTLDSWMTSIHPDDKCQVLDTFRSYVQMASADSVYEAEYRLRTDSGKYRWFRALAAKLKNEERGIIRVAGTLKDVHTEVRLRHLLSDEIGKLEDMSSDLSAMSDRAMQDAEATAAQVQAAACRTNELSSSGRQILDAATAMLVTVEGISTHATEAHQVATVAVETAQTTDSIINQLDRSSKEIGQVIKLITSIAAQTNLLALNATIEAARAGEFGRGFEVVAHEVKELAKETAKATDDIQNRVDTIQTDAHGAICAVAEIAKVFGTIRSMQGSIAEAVDRQTVKCNEIVDLAQGVNTQVDDFEHMLSLVADRAQKASESGDQSKANTETITSVSRNLALLTETKRK